VSDTAIPTAASAGLAPYDAILLLSFGGPESPDQVVPFLQNVTAGRGIPPERLQEVAQHYLEKGGRSPINDQNRALIEALRGELDRRGLSLPVLWGNRNWEPYVTDTLRQAADDGLRRVLVIVTSAYSSYSGCRQYREDLAAALLALGAEGRELAVDKIRPYFNSPGFAEVMTDSAIAARGGLPAAARARARLLFVTHSIPDAMNEASGAGAEGPGGAYRAQHVDLAAEIAGRLGTLDAGPEPEWDLVYCSRSGPPAQPWLEPDINDHLELLARRGTIGPEAGVVVVPIGFVSDHMEVIFDLDEEAAATAEKLGVPFARAATVGTDHRFVAALVDLALERAAQCRGEAVASPTVGRLGARSSVCPAGCCRNLRADRPAACGADWSGSVAS
jgi:ferrochelatase